MAATLDHAERSNPITIAVGAKTPIYLPLYMALKHDFYRMLPNCEMTPPPESEGPNFNADAWVQQQVHSGRADFGLCDPCVLQPSYDRVVLVGGLVISAAFWVVTKGLPCPNWDRLLTAVPDRLLVYPEGMTGHQVYRHMVRWASRAGDDLRWPEPTPVRPTDEINELRAAGGGTVLITANIVGALQLRRESPDDYEILLCCSTYPGLGDIVTTGVIAQTSQYDPEEQHRNRLRQFVGALQYALVDVRRREKVAAAVLKGHSSTEVEAQDATDAVRRMVADEIWPHHLGISRPAWHTTLQFHDAGGAARARMSGDALPRNEFAHGAYFRHVVKWARRSEPLKRYQVFVSSTYTDLKKERLAVAAVLQQLGHMVAGMEFFPGELKGIWDVIRKAIDQSDVYVVLIANRYGSLAPDGKVSWTEREFRYAKEERGTSWIMPFLSQDFDKGASDDGQRLEKFRALVEGSVEGRDVPRWEHVEDIRRQLKGSLETLGTREVVRSFWMRHEEPAAAAMGTEAGRPDQQVRSATDSGLSGRGTAREGRASRGLVDQLKDGLMAAYEETR